MDDTTRWILSSDRPVNRVLTLLLSFAFIASYVEHSDASESVSIESLLKEMVDRDAVARFPVHNFRLKQASSYNRASKTPDDPKGWFDNFDRSTSSKHHNFVRVEENEGRKEWVVMEDEGAGAITRFWVPWRNQLKPGTNVVIRFYLDGDKEPALEGNMFDLFQGKGLVPFPLAHESLRSAVSFLPIPYAKSCKVTMSDHPFFFQFTYRDYNEEVSVESFTMEELQKARPLIESTCKQLLNPSRGARQDDRPGSIQPKVLSTSATLNTNEGKTLSLPGGISAIRELSVKLGSYTDAEVTRKVVLKISFDGKQTVWCPIGDFFGSGIGMNPFQGWYRTVSEDGTMTSRWVMPYQDNATVSIENLGAESVDVKLSATVGDWKWDDRSMYFHAGWRGQYPVPTRPYSDWNYVNLKGRGVYVGDTLTIMNPVERWWGEGDEKIFVDGEDFPSIFGTGTEDYYAYSWGGRSTDFYEHPFHAQTFSHKYNKLNRKPKIDEKNTQGFSTETRTRALDTMPFASSLQLDMEVWSWTDCDMGYGVGCYWYGDTDSTSNLKPDPSGAVAVPPLPDAMADTPPVATIPKTTVQKTTALRAASEPPNYIIVFADDLGYQDLGCFGSPNIRTPRLDAMAAEGMRFTSFYAQSICGPSRAALMTGCYPMRVAERGGIKHLHPVLHEQEITVAELLKAKGYATGCFGKWDLAGHSQTKSAIDLFPTRQGFDVFFGTPTSNDGFVNLYRGEELIESKADLRSLTRRYTDEAIEFVEQHRDQPFFVYLPHTMPHTRLAASDRFRGKSPRGLYGDVVEEIDFNVGRLLDALHEMKLTSNTYVLFTSDNGPWLSKNKDHRDGLSARDHGGSAGSLRSGKVSTFEGGLRVPTILWAPGRVPSNTTCDNLASTLDVLPTLAALSDADVPTDRVIDGEDIRHLFRGEFEKADSSKAFFYYQRAQMQAVRQGRWKMHLPREHAPSPFRFNPFIAPEDRISLKTPLLFDLDSDVGETTDVADQNPQVVERLLTLANAMREDLGDEGHVGTNMRILDFNGPRPTVPLLEKKRDFGSPPKEKAK